jgi:hypothetical protein
MKKIVKNSFNLVTTHFTVFNHMQTLYEVMFASLEPYNNILNFTPSLTLDEDTGEVITLEKYNEFIKTIEPNLNRILFSKKVILVE